MKPFSLLFVPIALAAVVVQATAALAQEPPRPLRLHLGASPTPPVVPAPPPREVLEKDADEAIAVIEARKERERALEAILKAARGFERRPDLDRSVVEGIQTLNIQQALRRR